MSNITTLDTGDAKERAYRSGYEAAKAEKMQSENPCSGAAANAWDDGYEKAMSERPVTKLQSREKDLERLAGEINDHFEKARGFRLPFFERSEGIVQTFSSARSNSDSF